MAANVKAMDLLIWWKQTVENSDFFEENTIVKAKTDYSTEDFSEKTQISRIFRLKLTDLYPNIKKYSPYLLSRHIWSHDLIRASETKKVKLALSKWTFAASSEIIVRTHICNARVNCVCVFFLFYFIVSNAS